MPLMHCPHCRAENFTMEGWEDLDHCTSCGKPLGEPARDSLYHAAYAARTGFRSAARHQGSKGQDANEPRRA
jgi:hypothetical protein